MKKKYLIVISILLLAALTVTIIILNQNQKTSYQEKNPLQLELEGKKVIYIDSYSEQYDWSDGITKSIQKTFLETGIELQIFRMDTKSNTSEEYIKSKALEAKELIEEYSPDLIISSDDNAMKYLIMPYYKNSEIPIVFCGINWDASIYGLPYENTAGMVEVSLIPKLLEYLLEYSNGEKIGHLAGDTLSARREAEYCKSQYNETLTEKFVTTKEEWKTEFLKMQEDVDVILLHNNAAIHDWDETEMQLFMEENTKIPTGAIYEWMMPYSFIGFAVSPEEKGKWAAKNAKRIFNGENPADIPIVKNKKGDIMLNIKIANKMGITFQPALIKNAKKIIN